MAARPDIFVYRPAAEPGLAEIARLPAGSVGATCAHLHAQVQTCRVVRGRRRVEIAGRVVELSAGDVCVIAPFVPHRGLSVQGPPAAIENRYLEAAFLPGPAAGALDAHSALVLRGDSVTAVGPRPRPPLDLRRAVIDLLAGRAVAAIARDLGWSREGFSRAFTRCYGLSPAGYARAVRLDRARGLLRAGEPVAAVAFETGFADQSHFGRAFFASAGTSPARYRAAHRN